MLQQHEPPINLGAMGLPPAPPTDSAGRVAAEAEEARYYASETKKRGHRRTQLSKDVVHFGWLALIGIVALCIATGIVVLAMHKMLPANRCWLDKEHVDGLAEAGKVLLSGSVGALGTKFLGRNMEAD